MSTGVRSRLSCLALACGLAVAGMGAAAAPVRADDHGWHRGEERRVEVRETERERRARWERERWHHQYAPPPVVIVPAPGAYYVPPPTVVVPDPGITLADGLLGWVVQ